MIPDSLTIRGALFAYLFGPGRPIEREEASKVHGGICDVLGHDEMLFQYTPVSSPAGPQMKGFRLNMLLQEGRGHFEVILDYSGIPNHPVRLLMSYDWPPSMQYSKEQFDLTSKAVFENLQGTWMKVSAEARLRSQCSLRNNDALDYISKNTLNFSAEWLESFGRPLSFASIKLGCEPSYNNDPLENPGREFTIEILREDARSIYLELVSQWPQFSMARRGGLFEHTSIRPIGDKPSAYLEETYEFLKDRISSLQS